jgi:Zn-dependent protease with chaperone function
MIIWLVNPLLISNQKKTEVAQNIVDELVQELNLQIKVKCYTSNFYEMFGGFIEVYRINQVDKIFINRSLITKLSREELKAALAHELGHICLGHTNQSRFRLIFSKEREKRELAADQFAAEKFGLKDQLIRLLYRIPSITEIENRLIIEKRILKLKNLKRPSENRNGL